VGVWAALRGPNPRQELAWQVRAIIPLLNQRADILADTKVIVLVDGEKIVNPTVLEIRIFNPDRRGISSEAFDQRRPLRFEVGVPIVKLLAAESFPAQVEAPKVAIDNAAFAIGPDHIASKQSITVSLLLGGSDPQVTVPKPHLVNVDVHERPNNGEPVFSTRVLLVGTATALVSLFMGMILDPRRSRNRRASNR
jgi:hypothetical protein